MVYPMDKSRKAAQLMAVSHIPSYSEELRKEVLKTQLLNRLLVGPPLDFLLEHHLAGHLIEFSMAGLREEFLTSCDNNNRGMPLGGMEHKGQTAYSIVVQVGSLLTDEGIMAGKYLEWA